MFLDNNNINSFYSGFKSRTVLTDWITKIIDF